MYDLKINYPFMPHKRVANKQTEVRLTQDNSRQGCKTGVNKTEANEKPGR